MDGIDPQHIEFVLSEIKDGFIFEDFGCSFLSGVLGYNFIPHGGIKDKGIDGLEHFFCNKEYDKQIYQLSIEKNSLNKLISTLVKLAANHIEYDQMVFVTNQFFPDKDKVIDEAYKKYKKPVKIWDIKWFYSNANNSSATVRAYEMLINNHLYEFNKPGKSYIVGDMIRDPRLFVFLRQQVDGNKENLKLDKILADTLIIFALEDTDPEKGIVKTKKDILVSIKKHISFDPLLLHRLIEERLGILSKSPKRIQYHKKLNGYCLPYETRLQIQKRNIEDSSLHEQFKLKMEERLKLHLRNAEVKVKNCVILIEELINKIFYEQGMEFADFVLNKDNRDTIEKVLPDLISSTVDSSAVVDKNKEDVKISLLMTIRDTVYNGTALEKKFLLRLSNTYMMLFLVQCDPKLTMYFASMASQLNIYVCTSIIIPALSEYYLEPINRRYWNLLEGAYKSGVNLVINEDILQELINHFKSIIRIFNNDYKDNEYLYADKKDLSFIDEIMIRSYFYAKMSGQTSNFEDFLNNFISPNDVETSKMENEILVFLKEQFGIKYYTNKSQNISINEEDEDSLVEKLKDLKHSEYKARIKTRLILAINDFREKNNEKGEIGIFSYKTWWLSKDVLTYKTLCKLIQKDIVSCYIRADFLYNYISLAPKKPEVDKVFKTIFPSLVGVNISFHLPETVTSCVHQWIREHKTKSPERLKSILGNLAELLMTSPSYQTRESLKHYLENIIDA